MKGEAIRPPLAIFSSDRRAANIAATVEELEREGQPVTLVCLDNSRHEHEATRADIVHVPRLSAGVVASLVANCVRQPGRIVGSLGRLLGSALRSPRVALPALLRFPSAIHVAAVLRRRGVSGIRGIDAVAARVAAVTSRFCDTTPPDLSDLPIDWSRIGEGRIGLRWFSRHMNSIAAEVSFGGGDERVVIKRQRTHSGEPARERWALERRVLLSLRESMGGGPLTVPRVLFDDAENAVVVMERAPGTALNLLFIAAAADRSLLPRLAADVRGAGAWLRAMQAATRRTTGGSALLARLTATAIADVTRLAATDSALARHRREIVAFLENGERALSARELAVTGHHDDYWPGNIFVDGERVTVIDFESYRDGLELEDPAFFLIRCEMLRRRFRLGFPDLTQRFFEGYCPGQQPDAEALRFFTATKGLRSLAKGAGEELPALQRIWTRRMLRNIVLKAVRERSQSVS